MVDLSWKPIQLSQNNVYTALNKLGLCYNYLEDRRVWDTNIYTSIVPVKNEGWLRV